MILSGITAPFGRIPKYSDAIPELQVRYLSITHPFATNYNQGYPIIQSVRLACLSHAASVRSEPGSNSSISHVLCVDTCLLYTSDAADDTPCVDLGGRRIIKKKKDKQQKESTISPVIHVSHTSVTF
eukprot:TRINITY_DN13558_c0_g1_i4.p3 TRINITY_DN13558_c0_g1~~TRINITY_DN13558_c0_g1_i4.p3  ORF type:complete len:127 (+),score=0.45 TRINITY_DN13558_c0_g1_i4:452-832(+)